MGTPDEKHFFFFLTERLFKEWKQRACGVFTFRDIKNLTGHPPEQPGVGHLD